VAGVERSELPVFDDGARQPGGEPKRFDPSHPPVKIEVQTLFLRLGENDDG
jgi:hypothetical protein